MLKFSFLLGALITLFKYQQQWAFDFSPLSRQVSIFHILSLRTLFSLFVIFQPKICSPKWILSLASTLLQIYKKVLLNIKFKLNLLVFTLKLQKLSMLCSAHYNVILGPIPKSPSKHSPWEILGYGPALGYYIGLEKILPSLYLFQSRSIA